MNVMYGYTAAGFTGRMPCADIADAIISAARNLLYQTIHSAEAVAPEGARVIYGDTDSLFVLLPGVGLREAFRTTRELLDSLNSRLESPLELKLEKVYSAFVSFGKKRYAGLRLDHEHSRPALEAKGLENIRTDSFPLLRNFYDRALQLSLETRNLSRVRQLYRATVASLVGVTRRAQAESESKTSS